MTWTTALAISLWSYIYMNPITYAMSKTWVYFTLQWTDSFIATLENAWLSYDDLDQNDISSIKKFLEKMKSSDRMKI